MLGAPKVLLTGPPACGKTTAVVKIAAALDQKVRLAGFYTQEIRESGRRVGFRWHCLDGRNGTLAHVKINGPHRVGKYGVDIESFETEVVSVLDPDTPGVDLFVIDEIGKMECFSGKFVEAIRRLLKSDKAVLATVAQKGSGLIRAAKTYPGVELIHLSRENRDDVARQVVDRLLSLAE
jgi:nucleoside-triphosphatase